MLIKLGSIVTSASGSLGGHTLQHSKGGMQMRTKPIPYGAPSSAQLSIRSIIPVLQAGWRALSDAQRKIWNDYEFEQLAGHSLWMKYQYQRVFENLPFLNNPAYHLPTYLGPEKVLNGSFSLNANWIYGAGYSIHDGMLYVNNPPSYCFQYVYAIAGRNYQIKWSVLNLTSGAAGIQLGGAGYPVLKYASGNYYFNRIHSGGGAEIFLMAKPSDGVFQFDNISVKQIYNL